MDKGTIIRRILFVIFFIAFITSAALYSFTAYRLSTEQNQYTELQLLSPRNGQAAAAEGDLAEDDDPAAGNFGTDAGETANDAGSGAGSNDAGSSDVPVSQYDGPLHENKILARIGQIRELNPDFKAWLYIPKTDIDYPVMCREGDAEYYLHRDFYGNKSFSGTPFLAQGCGEDCDNLFVQGHNMKNGSMLAGLHKYESQDYYEAHKYIYFDTTERTGTFEIIAAFPETVHKKIEADAFRYYAYGGYLTEAKYEEFVEKAKAASLYPIETTARYGEQLLTMSTCSYHKKNGRFVVVAKRVQ